MRITIEIDDRLLANAMQATGADTFREAVELGLNTLVRLSSQKRLRSLRGKVQWHGDLDAMRQDGPAA